MLNYLAKRSLFRIYNFFNAFKFYVQKLPIIRKFWKNDSFAMEPLKKFSSALWPIFSIVFRFVRKFVYISILIGVSETLVNFTKDVNPAKAFEQTSVFLTLYAYFGVFNLMRYFVNQDNLIYYDLFKMPARTIGLAEVFYVNTVEILTSGLIFYLFKSDLGLAFAIKLHLMYLAMRMVSNAINAIYETKILDKLKSKNILYIISMLLIVALIGKDLIFNIKPFDFLNNSILFGLIMVAGVFAVQYLLKKLNYEEAFSGVLARFETIYSSNDSKEIMAKSSALKEEDYTEAMPMLDKRLSGYPMLNELFFQRHRRLIFRPILIKTLIISLACILLLGLTLLGLIEGYDLFVQRLPSYLLFVSYLLFFNEHTTRTMFINCDEAFLQYDFYNRPKDLLEMFTLRLKKLLKWNSPPLIVLLIFYIINITALGQKPKEFIIITVLTLSLWVFFVVHNLFVYYIFQPYNDRYEAKHPAYNIINIVIYVISYAVFQLSPTGPLIAPFFIGVTLLYTVLALIMVYRISPKTFKLRVNK